MSVENIKEAQRELFEIAIQKDSGSDYAPDFAIFSDGRYKSPVMQAKWEGWLLAIDPLDDRLTINQLLWIIVNKFGGLISLSQDELIRTPAPDSIIIQAIEDVETNSLLIKSITLSD